MLLFRTRSKVKVGQLHRYRVTYVPAAENVFPPPKSLYLRVRNTEAYPLRAAYLNGPFILYVDVKPSNFDPYKTTTSVYDEPAFEPQVKASQSFYAELKMDPKRTEHSWTIDVVSQLIFSASATVSFELSIGREKEAVHLDSEPGLFSKALVVAHQDTAAIWSSPRPELGKDVHLVVISHGLHSNTGADMLFAKEQIEKAAAAAGENVIVRGYFDNVCRTERGVKYLGKRMAKHIATTLRDPQIKKISFVGHSLGGLVMTYAIAYIHAHYPDFFEEIEPINFIALATPFLGISNENPLYVKFALDFGFVGKSGQDLGLTWKPATPFTPSSAVASKPLLRILPTGPAAEILRRFKRRTVYANAVNDGIVPLRTSSLLYLDWRALSKAEKARHGERVGTSNGSPGEDSHMDLAHHHHHRQDSKPGVGEAEDSAGEESFDDAEKRADGPGKMNVPNTSTQQKNANSNPLAPLQYAFSFLRPHATSVLESATSIINPPLPPRDFILNVESRPKTIFHDRIYYPEDLPQKPQSKSKPILPEKARVEEKIARAWHDRMSWRKVLVQLEPDAHNNIIVRRTFANAYGWPVIEHLVEHHFRDPYDPEIANNKESDAKDHADAGKIAGGEDQTKKFASLQEHESFGTMNSVSWDESAFQVTDSEDDDGEHSGENAIVRRASVSREEVMSGSYLQNIVGSGSEMMNYISEWTPMKLYSDMVGSPVSSEKSGGHRKSD
ncbi:putative serine esterase-domain-containing protein [Myxozyma melibiosi]|uniref:Serine esterase-domain-containing protein n=1 Tax=Myxozyma melibiosi TaxID=54550 RepID=A0ABR1F1Z0_9ASCO